MNLEEIRDTLLKSMEDQYTANKEALQTNQRLGQQKLMYSNEGRGTLYSGQPTWERAQLASQGATNLASLGSDYLKNKINVWDNITNTLDQINSYNKAAAAMAKAASGASSGSGTNLSDILNDIYSKLDGGTQ